MTVEINTHVPIQRKHRPWFQFGLRTLLVVVLLVAAGAAFWRQTIGYYRDRIEEAQVERERRAALADALKRSNSYYNAYFGFGRYDTPEWQLNMPKWIRRYVPAVDNEWFRRQSTLVVRQPDPKIPKSAPPSPEQLEGAALWGAVAEIHELESIGIEADAFGDDDLPRLAALPRLKLLNLRATAVTDAGLEHFKSRFPSLRYLIVPERVGESARKQLTATRTDLYIEASSTPSVRYVFRSDLTPRGDAEFARRDDEFKELIYGQPAFAMTHMHEGDLFRLDGGGRVRADQALLLHDPTFERLCGNPSLETLVINSKPNGAPERTITTEVIDRIVRLPTLRYVGLRGELRPHGVVERLKSLPRLEVLWLYDRTVDEADIAAVAGLPHLKRFLLTVPTREADAAAFEARVRAAMPKVEVFFDYENSTIDGQSQWNGPNWAVDLGGSDYFPMFNRMTWYSRSSIHGPLTQDDMVAVGRQKSLRIAWLELKEIRDEAMRELARLPELAELEIDAAGGLNPDGDPIGTIASIKSLKKVRLIGVYDPYLSRLKELRPDLEVYNERRPNDGRRW